jgi:hypothetical protein
MSETVDIDLFVMRDEPSDQAILVREFNMTAGFWLPRSQIRIEYKDQHHERAVVTMPVWLAEKHDLS